MRSRLLALVLLLLPAPALAGVKETVAALAPSGIVLVVDAKGNELVAQNADKPFVPASVTKIVTAWLAMEVLGGDYRFETRFYLDSKRVLYVRGGGDPYLISEELAPLATELIAKIGKAPITRIVVDASYYPSNLRIPGIEDDDTAYDALNSALGVNFNTIYAERSGNKVRSAEDQTPITPIAIARFRAKGPPDGEGRISLGQDPTVGLQYAGELIAAFIRRAGGSVKGEISIGTVPEQYVTERSTTKKGTLDPANRTQARTPFFSSAWILAKLLSKGKDGKWVTMMDGLDEFSEADREKLYAGCRKVRWRRISAESSSAEERLAAMNKRVGDRIPD